jgi:hypothetical protein
MKQHLILSGILILLLFSALDGCVGPLTTETVTKSYAANAETILTVSNFNGFVNISGWSGATINVTAVKRSSVGQADLANINISVLSTLANHFDIKTKYTGSSTTQPAVDLTIKVPYNVTVSAVTTSNGAIDISGTKGDAVLSTSNGAILVSQVNGFVSASTSNAAVELKGITGVTSIHTSNAAISAEVRAIRGDISIDTSNAAVTVYLDPSLNATVDASTSNAKVTVQGITLSISLLQDTHVTGTLGSGAHRIDIRTSNANVYLNSVLGISR